MSQQDGGKRPAEGYENTAKRQKSGEADGSAAAAADPYPGYDYDASSGWYLNRAAPEWQYNAATDVHFNAGESQFYRQDPVTQQYRHVTYDATTGAYTDTEPPAPDPEPTGLGQAGLLPHVADHTFMQGRRPTQEDRHTMIPDYGKKLQGLGVQASFYAVFDGHLGEQCSDFVSKSLHVNLATQLKKAGSPLSKASVKQAILQACADTDKEFLRIAKIRKRNDGCCAIALLILDATAFVINVGDSRAVAARDGTAEALSDDHKPERADEQARVEKSGGLVINFGGTWRVTTPEALAWGQQKIKKGPNPIQLAVARSFGDISLKTPRPLLLSIPEVTVVDLGKSDTLVLLGCDGIWDVLSNKTAVETAIEAGRAGKDPKGIAGAVVKLAYERGSTDNISVVACLLHARPVSE